MSTIQGPAPGWAAQTGHARVRPLVADAGGDANGRAAGILIAECINRYGWGYDERTRRCWPQASPPTPCGRAA